jgi:hypothetical protein
MMRWKRKGGDEFEFMEMFDTYTENLKTVFASVGESLGPALLLLVLR